MKLYKVIHRALISTAVFGALTIPAKADVDMSGKTIEWTIPFSETGGSAKWANFFATYVILDDRLWSTYRALRFRKNYC